jgi:pimeloyl-ACP methyl ester carboxylesterase
MPWAGAARCRAAARTLARVIAIDVQGDGPPLVLVHGVGTSRVVWRGVTPLLAAGRLVAAPDLPGFGASPPAGPAFPLDEIADALGDELAAALPAPFDLLGNSLGGAVALVLAARRPELVRRLVLAAPAGLAPRRDPIPAVAGRAGVALIAARRRAGPALAGNVLARRLLLLGMVADAAAVPAEEARRMVHGSEGSRRIAAAIAEVAGADLRPHLPELTMPVAFLWGTRDRVVPFSSLRDLRALVPGARAEVIEGCGHVPQLERPREFAAAVDRLLPAVTDP